MTEILNLIHVGKYVKKKEEQIVLIYALKDATVGNVSLVK